jgi:hypothetical protein
VQVQQGLDAPPDKAGLDAQPQVWMRWNVWTKWEFERIQMSKFAEDF